MIKDENKFDKLIAGIITFVAVMIPLMWVMAVGGLFYLAYLIIQKLF